MTFMDWLSKQEVWHLKKKYGLAVKTRVAYNFAKAIFAFCFLLFSFPFSTLFFGSIFFKIHRKKIKGTCWPLYSEIFTFSSKNIHALFHEINRSLSIFAIMNRFYLNFQK